MYELYKSKLIENWSKLKLTNFLCCTFFRVRLYNCKIVPTYPHTHTRDKTPLLQHNNGWFYSFTVIPMIPAVAPLQVNILYKDFLQIVQQHKHWVLQSSPYVSMCRVMYWWTFQGEFPVTAGIDCSIFHDRICTNLVQSNLLVLHLPKALPKQWKDGLLDAVWASHLQL